MNDDMPGSDFFLNQFNNLANLFCDVPIALPFVGPQAGGAVLDAVFCVGKIAAAVFAQGVEGAVAEDAAEGLRVGVLVAGEVFTLFVLEKIVMCHGVTSFELIPGEFVGGRSGEGQLLVGFGVTEAEPGGPEGDVAAVVQGAILAVTHQGEIPGGELAADLVGPACDQLDADFGEFGVLGQDLVVQNGLLDVLSGLLNNISLSFALIPGQQVHQGA